MTKILPVLGLCMALGACSTLGGGNASITAGKGLTDAAAALKGAADAADAAAKSGLLHGQTAATVSADLKQAQAALNDANTIYLANHSANIAVEIASVTALAADIITITTGASK
jgi:hypothetical protein